ncbi:hypothetical protein [Endozoicomonas sp. ONNA1]|uniref:hypothetical protein n=1 Tax=Endozoicomonas sp. ONNA1 TaxID=2828740 RepID=UPI002148A024|nr:hypothetical protein [Endozoicomonas sp. ONNA1]
MDQIIGSKKLSAAYTPLYTDTEGGRLSKNTDHDRKYLSKAEECTEDYLEHKVLSLRSISLAPTEKDKDHHYIALAKNIVANESPFFLNSIDDESWKNMADSLKFSNINSLEKAIAMDLRVCPPCPLFHTWVALHGTTIFNGLNTPKRLRGINYVERILKEGTDLSKNDIPLFIVFSEMNLTESQINEMKGEFKDHDNILCISLETDLQLKFPKPLEKHASSMSFEFMDSIRLVVSQHITETISFCIDKAKSENKIKLANRLEKLGTNYLFYSDIDNQWISKPPHILASHGIFSQPTISRSLPLIYIKSEDEKKLSDVDRKLLERHRSFFSELPYLYKRNSEKWSTDKAKKLFDYILSGEAECNFKHLSKQITHISPIYTCLFNIDEGVSWEGENSCFFVAEHSKEVFLRGALKTPWRIDLHQKPTSKLADDSYNPDLYYKEAHSLIGMQLLKYYYHGHDFTWCTW